MSLESLRKIYKDVYSTSEFSKLKYASTGILGLDALMSGGLPEGRIVEISGSESSSKTLISLTIAASFQKRGCHVGMVDAERTTTEKDLIRAGIDPKANTFHYFSPRNGEQALDIVKDMANTGEISFIIVDSVPYIKPEKSLEKETGAATMADVARLIGSQQTQLTNAAADNDCTILFINQTRAKMTGYGGQDTCGGKALKFMYSVRLQNRIQEIKKDGTGVWIEVKALKCKVGEPYKTTLIEIQFTDENAVDVYGSFRIELQKLGWIEQKGSYFYLVNPYAEVFFPDMPRNKDNKLSLGQGLKSVRTFFSENPEAYKKMYQQALNEIQGNQKVVSTELKD